MPYDPPLGNNVEINFNGEYVAPPGDAASITFGNVLDNWIRTESILLETFADSSSITEANLIESADLVVEFTVANSLLDPLIHLNAESMILDCICASHQLEILPDIVNESLLLNNYIAGLDLGGGAETDLPSYLNPGFSVSYGGNVFVDTFFSVPWGYMIFLDKFVGNNFLGFFTTDNSYLIPWQTFYLSDNLVFIDSSSSDDYADISVNSSWDFFIKTDRLVDFEYTGFRTLNRSIDFQYNEAFAKDRFIDIPWDSNSEMNRHFKFTWTGIGINDIDYVVNYGPKALYKFCFEVYEPPPSHIGPNFVFPPRNAAFPGIGEAVGFIMDSYSSDPRCETIHMYTGIRDINIPTGTQINPVYPFRVRQVYYMLNTVLVKEVPSNAPIEIKALTMTTDRDSWLWQLSMTVGKKSYVNMIKPDGGVFKKVEVYINGWRWIFSIEGWQENAGFARGTWTVTGRSPSLVLGDPICPQKSYVHTDVTGTGSSIIDNILQAGGYSFSVSYVGYGVDGQSGFSPTTSDWNIPANAFSYSNQTDIQAIQTLVDSIGGYVQTVPDDDILEILPKYSWQPWQWRNTIAEIDYKQLDKSIVSEIGSTYRKNPDYFGVYMIGTTPKSGGAGNGVFCDVRRDGYGAGTAHAPISSSPLYTTNSIAQEKGRMILGDSGMWMDHSVKVFSLFPPGEDPGLFKVGDIVNVTESSTIKYRGIITSTSISAGLANGSAFNVSQTLGLSEYIGEWE